MTTGKEDITVYEKDSIQQDIESLTSKNFDSDDISESSDEKSISNEIPDKLSGWGLYSVIAVFIFNLNTWGANSAYALYLQTYLNSDIFPNATKYDYGIIGGITFGFGLAFSPFINRLIGLIGMKPTIAIGIVLNFLGIFLASFSKELWHVYLTQGVLTSVGMAMIAVPNIAVIPQWFKGGPGGKRNLAMGITAAGSGLGGIIYNICMQPLLHERSFRWSLRVQAIMGIGLNCIALLIIKSRNSSIKPVYKVYDKLIWTSFGCHCMFLWVMFTSFGYVVLMYNLGDFTRSLGYSSKQASIVSTMVAVGIIYGRPIIGRLGDKIGPINITMICSWIVTIFTLGMWIPCRNFATAFVFALIVGSMMGTIWLTMATVCASIVGLKKFGIGMSLCWVATGVFGFCSPIIGISLKKDGPVNPEQYQPAAIFVGLCYFMAGFCLYILRSWVACRNEQIAELGDGEEHMLSVKIDYGKVLKGILKPRMSKV
ncbi:hypothetical protein DAMA08_052830 [Martiniozyma asiatica (nom. inval.)]|nr:hypothetical protein DAMA08_052830 [Martiniozyma asiatica]